MPSSYTSSLRLTLQATGENNNTWGVILNNGVFGLVDYAVAGRLAFSLSGTITLTTALGATDQARAAFLDVTGGSGGSVVIPAVSKGYFVRNASAGDVAVGAGGAYWSFNTGDIGPVFTDGSAVYGIQLSGKPLKQFITDADQAVINYVNLAISQGSIALPPATDPAGRALMIRDVGLPAVPAWVPSVITPADVPGVGALAVPATWTASQFFSGGGANPAMRVKSAAEVFFNTGGALNGVFNFDAASWAGVLVYVAPTGNFSINIRASAGQTFDNWLPVADAETLVLIVSQGATTFTLTSVSIDGITFGVNLVWAGGIQPVPMANSFSVYTFAIIKGGPASYTTLASMTRFGP